MRVRAASRRDRDGDSTPLPRARIDGVALRPPRRPVVAAATRANTGATTRGPSLAKWHHPAPPSSRRSRAPGLELRPIVARARRERAVAPGVARRDRAGRFDVGSRGRRDRSFGRRIQGAGRSIIGHGRAGEGRAPRDARGRGGACRVMTRAAASETSASGAKQDYESPGVRLQTRSPLPIASTSLWACMACVAHGSSMFMCSMWVPSWRSCQ